MVLWGLVQVTCGLFIRASMKGYWGHNVSTPLNNPLFVVAVSSSYITAGMCSIAFGYFRGKALMIAVVVSSALSLTFGTTRFILLVVSHRGKKTPSYDNEEEESVYLCKGTIEAVIVLGSISRALFLFVFLHTAPGFLHLEQERDSPPPSYDMLELGDPPPPYDTIEMGNHLEEEMVNLPPPYDTIETSNQQVQIRSSSGSFSGEGTVNNLA